MQKLTLEIQKILGNPLAAIMIAAGVFVLPKLLHDGFFFLLS